ncbi:hypothetical protein OROMI_017416 [Orobanche minor]
MDEEESLRHVLSECVKASDIWYECVRWLRFSSALPNDPWHDCPWNCI